MNTQYLFDLAGRKAVVTGGNSGLGAAMAYALGSAGASVMLVARREDALADSAGFLRKRGIDASFIQADLSDLDSITDLSQAIMARMGGVDILVNAAGVNTRQPLAEVTPASWNTQLSLNLSAPFFMTQGLAPTMAESGWGRIINLGSLQSFRAFQDGAHYGAAKGGIVQLTRALAQEWSPKGITCNAIAPGFFPTALTAPVFKNPDVVARNAAQTCLGRNGQLEDIYGVTVFLASEASAYITGQTIMLDGGFTSK